MTAAQPTTQGFSQAELDRVAAQHRAVRDQLEARKPLIPAWIERFENDGQDTPLQLVAQWKAPVAQAWQEATFKTTDLDRLAERLQDTGNLGLHLGASRRVAWDADNAAGTDALNSAGVHIHTVSPGSLRADHKHPGGCTALHRLPYWVPDVRLTGPTTAVELANGGLIDVLAGHHQVVLPPSVVVYKELGGLVGRYMTGAEAGYCGPERDGWLLEDEGESLEIPLWALSDELLTYAPAGTVVGEPPAGLEALAGTITVWRPVEKKYTPREGSDELTEAIGELDLLTMLEEAGVKGERRGFFTCGPCENWLRAGSDAEKSITVHDCGEHGRWVQVWTTGIPTLPQGGHSRLDAFIGLTERDIDTHRGSEMARLGLVKPREFDSVTADDLEDVAAALEGRAAAGETTVPGAPGPAGADVIHVEVGVDGLLRRAARCREAAAVMTAEQHTAAPMSDATFISEVMIGMETAEGEPRDADGTDGGDDGDSDGADNDPQVENTVTTIAGGLPAAHPELGAYRRRAEDEARSPSFDVDWSIIPATLIPQDLRPLRESVTGPRASSKPVLAPARDAAVAQALAKAVGGTKLLRDVERSTRAAQANLSWDGTRWVNDPDAAGVVIDALLSTHMFDTDPAIRQQKILVIGTRKPDDDEEEAQLQAAKEAALAKGEMFSEKDFVPQPMFFHDQKWADASSRTEGLTRIIGRQPEVAITETKRFDANSRMLASDGGYIKLGTDVESPITVTAPDPAALITKKLGAAFDPKATCPEWLKFLEQVQPDRKVRSYLQRATGMGLLGSVRNQVILVLTGEGANGKGVYTNVLLKLLGGYGVALNSRTLTAKSQDDHPAALMPLRGARIAVVDELPEGIVWAANLIKHLTGGGVITARWMNENPQSWDPTHTIILTTNGHPLVPPGEKAFWRRYREIPFTQSFATTADELASGGYAGMADDGLEERLIGELPGILNWVLDGYRDYLVRGLDEPEAVLEAGRKARADSSSFASFAASMFEVTGSTEDKIRTRDVWNAWSSYRRSESEMSHQRPNSERDLVPILIKELGKKVSHQKSTGGKSPACLLGLKWSEEGQELANRSVVGTMLPSGFTQGGVMPRLVPDIGTV